MNAVAMRKTAVSLAASGLLVALTAPPVGAHGANGEIYTATAPVPFPNQESRQPGGCTHGVEDVNKDSHPFSRPMPGVLKVVLSEFTGDWDVYIIDAQTRAALASGVTFIGNESISAFVQADQDVSIEACNWGGSPTAAVNFTFTPSADNFVSIGNVWVHEGDSGTRGAAFTVSLSKPSTSEVTVGYATADDSATAGSDYTTRSGTLTFPAGTTSQVVKVPVTGDTATEGGEAFLVNLSSPSGIAIGDGIGVATVVDDDPSEKGRRLAIGDALVHEGNDGGRVAVFNVSLSKASASYVKVDFATATGTATGGDFAAKTGTVTFPPGATTKAVKVAVSPDTDAEDNETFTVNLSGASGATVSDGTGAGTIVDED